MAKYNIKQLNYIAVGENRNFINMDIELEYQLYDYIHLLCSENQSSGYVNIYDKKTESNFTKLSHDIGVEQGDGFYYKANYIQKESSQPLSKENLSTEIILNEKQEIFIEQNPNNRDYIRLYLSCCTIEMKNKINEFNSNRTQLNCTYLADNITNNKNNLTCQNNHLYDLYDITDVSIKKQGIHDSINNYLHDVNYHHDIFAPSFDYQPIGFCQAIDNTSYSNDALLITQNIKVTPKNLKSSYNNFLSSKNIDENVEYSMEYDNSIIDTYTYKIEDECISSDNTYSILTNPKRNYYGLKYSYILDLPVDEHAKEDSRSTAIAPYDLGEIFYYRMHIGKNAYNPTYSMQMDSLSSIKHCRSYCQINTCAGIPYLKYYDDLDYCIELSSELCSTNQIKKLITYESNSITNNKYDVTTKPYQKIEFIYPVDYSSTAKHKLNIFTVNILDTEIENAELSAIENENVILQKKLKMLKFDIKSAISDIAKNICPANTQLFNTYFGGND